VLQKGTWFQQPQTEANEAVEKACKSERNGSRKAPGDFIKIGFMNNGENGRNQNAGGSL
jgi:hypothetical protein